MPDALMKFLLFHIAALVCAGFCGWYYGGWDFDKTRKELYLWLGFGSTGLALESVAMYYLVTGSGGI